jgi:hypothetical protein
MINNKQSSVEWFAEKTFNLVALKNRNLISHGEFLQGMLKLRDEAKAMHKEEIKNACQEFLDTTLPDEVINEYYEQTYRGNND